MYSLPLNYQENISGKTITEQNHLDSSVVLVPDSSVNPNPDPPKELLLIFPNFPLIVCNEDFFYVTEGFEPAAINRWKRKNGWYRPINISLVVLWITWGIAVGFYYGFFQNVFLSNVVRTSLSTIVGVSTLIQGGFTLYCISADVEDDVVTKAKKPRNTDYIKISGIPVIDSSTLYCQICQVHVKPETKHCKTCNKCVEKYDHHCIFMSTCIGKRNYKEFIVSITLAFIIGIYFGAVSLYSFILYFVDRNFFFVNLLSTTEDIPQLSLSFLLIGILLYCGLISTVAIGLSHLAIFHYRIAYIGITTVGYFDIRQARGPLLWDINTKEHRQRMKDADRHRINFHELNH